MPNDELLKTINDRLAAIGEQVSEQRLQAIVKAEFDRLSTDDAFVRKMRFGAGADTKLLGSKYARWGLNAADVEWLYDVLLASHDARISKRGPSEELRNAFAAISKAVYYSEDEMRAMGMRELDAEFARVPRNAFHGADRALAEAGLVHLTSAYKNAVRAMDTAESGYGSQLVGAQYVGDLWEAARPDMRVANLIGSFEMQAPTVYMPVEVDFPAMLYVSESTSSTVTDYTTSKTASQRVSVTADKFVIHQMWSGEMEEDSILPFVPFLRAQAAKSLAYYQDSLALNGDETGTNGINGADSVLAATTHTLAFNGIRHAALVDNVGNKASAANAPVDLDMFRGAYTRMIDATYKHDWGHPNDPNDVVHVVDPYTADAMLGIDEFKTLDKAGNAATIFQGQVARVYNHPVISSIAMGKSENTGYVDETPGDNLYGQIVTFNRNGLKWGWRRHVKVETERIPSSDQTRIIYSLRLGLGRFTPTGADSGIEWADEVYYINL